MKIFYRDNILVDKILSFFEPCEKLLRSFNKYPSTHIQMIVERERRLLTDPIIKQLIMEMPFPKDADVKLKLVITRQLLQSGSVEKMTSNEIAKMIGVSGSAIRYDSLNAHKKLESHYDEIANEFEQEEGWNKQWLN